MRDFIQANGALYLGYFRVSRRSNISFFASNSRDLSPSVEAAVPAANKGHRVARDRRATTQLNQESFRLGRRRYVGEDWRGADIGSVEAEAVIPFLQRF